MKYLFLFTITPVQSFISQARKTQDLWAGSRMLSDLVGKVFDKIHEEGGLPIFPTKKADSLPNRILAEFDFEKTDQELKDLGKKIADEVAIELYELTKKAKNKIGSTEYAKIENAFENQLKDYFSTFWVFVEVENNDYVAAYEKSDRLLGAVKNARTFTQYPEQGRKCSLSGEQNALVFNQDALPSYAYNVSQVDDDSIGSGEGLSAISYIKRFYPFGNQRKSFDSTAEISLLRDIENTPTELLRHYKSQFQGSYFDEQLLFEENLTVKYFEKNGLKKLIHNSNGRKRIKKPILDGYSQIKKYLKTKYYAILLFDADSMGKWLSGEFIEESKKAEQLYDFHKHLSKLLSGFADYAKKYVDGDLENEKKKGRTVYAGGDDYLGFVNLHYLFDVMKYLREEFEKQVSKELKFDKENNKSFDLIKDEMTFSAGIAIAHYKTPLSEVLDWARKMEKEAKDTDNKDSFGIAVLKKSGEIHKTVLPFRDTKSLYFSDNLQKILDYLFQEKYSSNFINVLERELSLFGEDFDYRRRIVKSEARRLVENSRNKQKTPKTENEKVFELIDEIYDSTDLRTTHKDNHFHTTLNICDFINRKLKGND